MNAAPTAKKISLLIDTHLSIIEQVMEKQNNPNRDSFTNTTSEKVFPLRRKSSDILGQYRMCYIVIDEPSTLM